MNPAAFILETVHAVTDLTDLFQKATRPLSLIRDKVLLCTAIAKPETFIASVRSLGADIRHEQVFMDHHVFTQEDVTGLIRCCREKEIKKVVVTHKDAVKLMPFASCFEGISVFVVNMEIKVIYGEAEFISRLDRLLDA